jgi:O-antigen/teichoic acid export membrane protein
VSTTKKLIIGSASRTLLSLSQMAVGFFMLPFLVRNLGDHWYGVWTVIGSTFAYLTMMDLGLSQAIILYLSRYIATKEHDKANAVVNTAIVVYSGISVCVLVLAAVLAFFIDKILGNHADVGLASTVIMILGVSLAIELPFNSFSGIIGAYVRYELLSLTRLIVLLVNTTLTVYFISRGYGILALAFIQLVSCILFNILFYTISKHCFRELKVGRRYFDRSVIGQLTHISAWSFVSNVSYLLKFKLNAIVVSALMSPAAVTHFAVGSRLADYFRDFLFQATNLTTPVLTRYHVLEKEDELRNKLLFLTKINTALAFMGGGVILIVGHAFIATWMGTNYLDAYPILVVLVVAMMFEITIDPSRCALAAMGKNRLIALLEVTEAALNVALSIVLGMLYGPIGVALGTAIPLILMKVFVAPKIVCRLTKTRLPAFYGAIAPIVLMTAGYLGVYGYVAHEYMIRESYLNIVAVGSLAVPLYLLLAYRFFFDPSEIALLKQMLPGRRAAPAV